jgi:hypothetical protein
MEPHSLNSRNREKGRDHFLSCYNILVLQLILYSDWKIVIDLICTYIPLRVSPILFIFISFFLSSIINILHYLIYFSQPVKQ